MLFIHHFLVSINWLGHELLALSVFLNSLFVVYFKYLFDPDSALNVLSSTITHPCPPTPPLTAIMVGTRAKLWDDLTKAWQNMGKSDVFVDNYGKSEVIHG